MLTRSPRLLLWPVALRGDRPSGVGVGVGAGAARAQAVTMEERAAGGEGARADAANGGAAQGGAAKGSAAQGSAAQADPAESGGESLGAPRDAARDTTAEGSVPTLPAAWFHEHVEALWRLVARLGVPAHSVDDVVQETFMVAARRRADIGFGHERAFLTSTAVRLCSNYRQRAHVRREVGQGDGFEGEVSPLPDAEQLLIEKRWRELLDRVLAELSDTHRTLFVLFELEGFSAPDIAQLLELPLGTVSSRLWRARARFSEIAAQLHSSMKEAP